MLIGYIAIKTSESESESDEQLSEQIALFFLLMTFGTSLGLSACWLASFKNLKFVELYGSALAGSSFVAMAICVYTDIVDVSAPQFGFKIMISFLYYILDAGLMSSNIVPKIF